jgi:hypothetical protein
MRDETTTESDSAFGVRRVPWHVIEVRVVSDHAIAVRFRDGTQGEVDLTHLLTAHSPGVFAALRDPVVFRQVYLDHGAVTWPGEIDLAPDAMYDDIRSTGRSMPA